jgi:hypothetical protein
MGCIFLAMLFDFFVIAMFIDQMMCIWQGTSTIDSMRSTDTKEKKIRTGWENLEEVFSAQGSYLAIIWPYAKET